MFVHQKVDQNSDWNNQLMTMEILGYLWIYIYTWNNKCLGVPVIIIFKPLFQKLPGLPAKLFHQGPLQSPLTSTDPTATEWLWQPLSSPEALTFDAYFIDCFASMELAKIIRVPKTKSKMLQQQKMMSGMGFETDFSIFI